MKLNNISMALLILGLLITSIIGVSARTSQRDLPIEIWEGYFENCYLRAKLGIPQLDLNEGNVVSGLITAYGELPYLRRLWELKIKEKTIRRRGGHDPISTPQFTHNDGDATGDGKVDEKDYEILREYFGTNNPQADFNGDGEVSLADFSILKANYNK